MLQHVATIRLTHKHQLTAHGLQFWGSSMGEARICSPRSELESLQPAQWKLAQDDKS